jgi:hypothetical protein
MTIALAMLLVLVAVSAAGRERADTQPTTTPEVQASTCGRQRDDLLGVSGELDDLFGVSGDLEGLIARGARSVGEETLWIFDADFEDLSGDNAGWLSLDQSGTLERVNYWHKDTIHMWNQHPYHPLGDSTWWCGTYADCWRQPRGYGNNWTCMLVREFPEVAEFTDPGDALVLEYDQRYALENDYDYGYTEVSSDGGATWTTLHAVDNPGFAGHPGVSQDWNSIHFDGPGHMSIDLGDYAGQNILIRFRMESDGAYSSQDEYNNPPFNSCLDGAWQLDNIMLWTMDPDSVVIFLDDCESPGDNGWVHENLPTSGQTGVVFERIYDPEPGAGCPYPPLHWWMAAFDSETDGMVDGEDTWLISPPIDISGADGLVGYWETWIDCPGAAGDAFDLQLASVGQMECAQDLAALVDEAPGVWTGGPSWVREFDNWDAFAGPDWLAIGWHLFNDEQGTVPHRRGLMLDRQRVGVPIGGNPTLWDYWIWDRFHDTFDLSEALTDTATLFINDDDGIVSARMLVSSDDGATWDEHTIIRQGPESDTWTVPPPTSHIAEHTEVRYYFETTDGSGNVRRNPKTAPETYYEFSVLPIHGSVGEPSILLVNKHGRLTPSENRHASRPSESFYREALDILGFEYDVFDVEVPSSVSLSDGPDSSGMKYYDTQIWFTNEFNAYTLGLTDQSNLISWLSQSAEGKERNLLLTGNDIGQDLVEYNGDPLGFYGTWLASEYVQNDPGGSFPDTMPILRDYEYGFDFMTYDDRSCHLWSDW